MKSDKSRTARWRTDQIPAGYSAASLLPSGGYDPEGQVAAGLTAAAARRNLRLVRMLDSASRPVEELATHLGCECEPDFCGGVCDSCTELDRLRKEHGPNFGDSAFCDACAHSFYATWDDCDACEVLLVDVLGFTSDDRITGPRGNPPMTRDDHKIAAAEWERSS